MPTYLSDTERAGMGGARTYSRSDFADFMRKRNMPEFQTERETRYRFMTPEVIARYAGSFPPGTDVPMGVPMSQAERDARSWRREQAGRQTTDQASPEGYALARAGGQPGGGIVGQLLAGPPVSGRRTTDDGRQTGLSQMPAEAPAGGAERPLFAESGRPPVFAQGATPGKPGMFGPAPGVMAAMERRAEFERRLEKVPKPEGWHWERPGMFEEADKRRQAMREQFEQEEASRAATVPALAAAAGQEAVAQEWLRKPPVSGRRTTDDGRQTGAEPEGMPGIMRTAPAGLGVIKPGKFAVSQGEFEAFRKTADAGQMKEFRENYMLTPEGWKRKGVSMADAWLNLPGMRPAAAAAKPRSTGLLGGLLGLFGGAEGGQTTDAGRQTTDQIRAFATEAEAMNAGLPVGTIVTINGRRAVIE